MNTRFVEQARLMLRVMPQVAKEDCFALKGGTAINFFLRDMPRLSVDIDLTYLPIEPREESLRGISQALARIKIATGKAIPGVKVREHWLAGFISKLIVRGDECEVKIEPNLVMRGALEPPVRRTLSKNAVVKFGMSLSARTLSDGEIFGGKICAALDRQHPRDLFDVKSLLDNEGITPSIRKAFVVCLVSHDRPMHELFDPPRKDVRALFESQLEEMTAESVTYEELTEAHERLIARLRTDLTDPEKKFLISVKECHPDWSLMDQPGIEKLPAIQWKLQNIQKMDKAKYRDQLLALKNKLGL